MSHMRLLMTILVSVIATSSFAAFAEERQKPYAIQHGPIEAKLGDQAILKLPDGYTFLASEDAQRALKQMGNFPSGRELGLVMSDSKDANWFVVISYVDAGFVKDDDADNWDADAMFNAIKAGTEEDNKKRQE